MKQKTFLLHWSPLILYCTLIFAFSSMPRIPVVSELTFPFADKLIHIAEYFVLGLLVFYAFNTTKYKQYSYIIIILFAFLYGLSDELHQIFVPGRGFQLGDLLADTIGGALSSAFLELKKLFYRTS